MSQGSGIRSQESGVGAQGLVAPGRGRWCLVSILVLGSIARAEDPCVSGLMVGQRPGPYAFVVSTGKERGQPTCFICETADKPAVIVFARNPSKEVGELVAELDKAVADSK